MKPKSDVALPSVPVKTPGQRTFQIVWDINQRLMD